ncbi:MAG: hypothetical protein PHD48_05075 [Alphaproteobacteria bacterium]|nr:hypothetical protein [Alphaproteobacteria bacterium]
MGQRFPMHIFNPFTTRITAGRYLPLIQARPVAAPKKVSSAFLNRLISGEGNPARAGYTGVGTEIRVAEPTQPHTYTHEKKPEPTTDHTGPAAGPSPKATPEAMGQEWGPSPKKGGKGKQKAVGKKKHYSIKPAYRPKNMSRDEYLRVFGAGKPLDLD